MMHPLRAGDKAWIALGAAILTWDICCPPGETLSEATHRYTTTRPAATRIAILYTAGHLMHLWPRQADLFTQIAALPRNRKNHHA